MTFAQWTKNNTKINDGKDFEESYLVSIFERIAKTPLKLTETPVSEDGPRKVLPPLLPLVFSFSPPSDYCFQSAPFSTCYRLGIVKTMMQCSWTNILEVFDFFMLNSDVSFYHQTENKKEKKYEKRKKRNELE